MVTCMACLGHPLCEEAIVIRERDGHWVVKAWDQMDNRHELPLCAFDEDGMKDMPDVIRVGFIWLWRKQWHPKP